MKQTSSGSLVNASGGCREKNNSNEKGNPKVNDSNLQELKILKASSGSDLSTADTSAGHSTAIENDELTFKSTHSDQESRTITDLKGTDDRRSKNENNSVTVPQSKLNLKCRPKRGKMRVFKSNRSQDSSSGRGTNMTRTISQSMFELDGGPQSVNYHRGFKISWSNVSFAHEDSWLNRMKGRKNSQVLNNLSGGFRSNQLVAIIGPSGCGKTTLLKFLSGNTKSHRESFRITGLDEPKIAFIGQGDVLLPNLTTKETLVYASRLQNTRSNFDHEKHVEPILMGLGLSECRDRNVAKLSGGQAKRVAIGQELLYPTNLLILDEITSGLDASTSYSIVKLLKQLASDTNYPMAIIMSIHQPSARLFSVFDRVYVMSEGHCLYDGTCDIETINGRIRMFGAECPKFHNIADYLIEIASDALGSEGSELRLRMIEYQRKQNESMQSNGEMELEPQTNGHLALKGGKQDKCMLGANDLKSQIEMTTEMSKIELDIIDGGGAGDLEPKGNQEANDSDGDDKDGESLSKVGEISSLLDDQSQSLYEAVERARRARDRPFFKHFLVHLARSSLRVRRSKILTYLQVITYLGLALQLATFFGHDIGKLSGCPQLPLDFIGFLLSNDDEDVMMLEMRSLQENLNFLLVSVMTVTFAALEITVITFPMEAKTVKREWRNGRYRVASYFTGRTLADFPLQLVCVSIFSTLTYYSTGQTGSYGWRFVIYLYIMLMVALIAQSVGFAFGALFMDNLPAAVFMAPFFIFPSLLFSGFFARVSQIPKAYRYMANLSHFRFIFEALIATLYGYGRCSCVQSNLDRYHESLRNQTSSIREVFGNMIGAQSCQPTPLAIGFPKADENSIEETTGFSGDINSIIVNETTTTAMPFENQTGAMLSRLMAGPTTTARPSTSFEDVIIDKVFEHINNRPNDTNSSTMDYMMDKFSGKVTKMFNNRNNFGRPAAIKCENFSSYLMNEFDIQDCDLIIALTLLTLMTVASRIISNVILNMTIRSHVD